MHLDGKEKKTYFEKFGTSEASDVISNKTFSL